MSPRPGFSGVGSAALFVAAAVLSQAWILALPFRYDDLLLIDSASDWLSRTPAGGAELRFWGVFRPTFWALIALERVLFSEPLQPTWFYAVALAVHAAVSCLVWRIARVFVAPGAAFVGGLVFAICPAGTQALAWIAAGGDALVALFLALGLLGALEVRRRAPAALLAGLCVALAAGSKVSGFFGIPVLALVLLRRPMPAQPWRPIALLLVLPIALFLVRGLYLGSWMPYHLAPATASLDGTLGRLGSPTAWRDLFTQLLAPWNLSPEAEGTRPFAARLGALVGLDARVTQSAACGLIAVLLLMPPLFARRSWWRLISILAALVVLAVPAVWVWLPGTGTFQNRNLYPLSVPLALLSALSAEAVADLWRSRSRLRPILGAGLASVALLVVDSWRHTVAYHELVAHAIESRVDSLDELSRSRGAETVFVLEDQQIVFAEQHLIGPYVAQRFARPFRANDLRIMPIPELPAIVEAAMLVSIASPVQFAAVRDHRYVAVRPWAAGMPTSLPTLRRVAVEGPSTAFEPEVPVSPRAVYGVAVNLPAGEQATLSACVKAGGPVSRMVIPRSELPRSRCVVLGFDADVLSRPNIGTIELQSADTTVMGLPRLVPHPAEVDAVSPGEGDVVALVDLAFVVPSSELSSRAVLQIMLPVGDAFTIVTLAIEYPEARGRPAGSLLLDPARASSLHGPVAGVGWPHLAAYLADLSARRSSPTAVFWRVLLVEEETELPILRTQWRRLLVEGRG